jgi:N-acetylglucosamine repressor
LFDEIIIEVNRIKCMTFGHSFKNGLSSTRGLNIKTILSTIRTHVRISRQQIARITKLSIPTVWRLIDELLAYGIVRERAVDTLPKTRGPKTSFVEINSKAGWVAAIEIASERIRAAAMDLGGSMLEAAEKDLVNVQGSEAVSLLITKTLNEILEKFVPVLGKPLSIGVSSIGMIDSESGVLKLSFHLQLKDFPLARVISQGTDAPILMRNDVASSALAEARLGLGRTNPNFGYITVGTGINANYVFNGQVYNRDYHNEFGLMIVAPEGDPERFEGRGFLESLASGRGIAVAARHALENGSPSRISEISPQGPAFVTHAHVIEAAIQGDGLAIEILARAANYLAIGIVNVANILSLKRFVIDGSVSEAGAVFWKPLTDAVRKYEYWSGEIQLQPSELKGNAALLGAGLLAQDQAFDNLAGYPLLLPQVSPREKHSKRLKTYDRTN